MTSIFRRIGTRQRIAALLAAGALIGLVCILIGSPAEQPPSADDGATTQDTTSLETRNDSVAASSTEPDDARVVASNVFAEEKRGIFGTLRYPVHPIAERAKLATLLHETGVQIGAKIEIDVDALKQEGIAYDGEIPFVAPRQSGQVRLTKLMRLADAEDRLLLTADVDASGRLMFRITTATGAERSGLLVVPLDPRDERIVEAAPLPSQDPPAETKPKIVPAVATTSTPGEAGRLKMDPQVAEAAAKLKTRYMNTFRGRLLTYARRMGMSLRLDWVGVREGSLYYAGPLYTGKFVEPKVRGAAIDELKSFLAINDPHLEPIFVTDQTGEKSLFITSRKQAQTFGPNPKLEAIRELRPWGGVSEEIRIEVNMIALSEGLKLPITGSATEPKLADALKVISRRIGIAIRFETAALAASGITPDEIVEFDPRGREARAVIYELLRQADPLKLERVVYCFERAESGDFQLVITTREAAQRAGRTIPFDLIMMNDDV